MSHRGLDIGTPGVGETHASAGPGRLLIRGTGYGILQDAEPTGGDMGKQSRQTRKVPKRCTVGDARPPGDGPEADALQPILLERTPSDVDEPFSGIGLSHDSHVDTVYLFVDTVNPVLPCPSSYGTYAVGVGGQEMQLDEAHSPSEAPVVTGALERLVRAVTELASARTLDAIVEIVGHAARELTGADGATFVLRDRGGDQELCYYVDEDAIAPLWRGHKFPVDTCISGWAMLNREPAVIEDIYADDRIPHDAYRPTFVKSLVMVPVHTADPVAAIGNYWAEQRRPTATEVRLLQVLADSTAVALENVQVVSELETRVEERTAELAAANAELQRFAAVVAHDLKGPLDTLARMVEIGELPTVRGDARLLGQVLQNLLANAITYTRDGEPPDVSITARRVAGAWEVSVADRGPGVPTADREGIFEPFRRGDMAGEFPGSGLGLAISRGVVERHGGTLRVADRDGGGAVFSVTLPEAPAL